MLDAGLENPVPMEELEIHLREEIERRMQSGVNAARGFEIAVQEIGRPNLLKSEFRKNERINMKRTMFLLTGIFGVLLGASLIMPAMAWYREHGTMPATNLEFLLLGIVIYVVGSSAAIYGFKKRTA